MTEYLTEQEQIEQLKRWLKLYGIPALLGILAGVAIFYGWNYYQTAHTRTLSHASRIYDEMLTDRVHGNDEGTHTQAQKLFSHYAKTPYGEAAALMLSREAINKKDYAEALKQLNWVVGHNSNPSLRQIARLRIARVYLAQQKPDEAINELKEVDDPIFKALIDEILGDAHLAMHQTTEARQAYQQALQELPNSDEIRPLLEMKLDNLASMG